MIENQEADQIDVPVPPDVEIAQCGADLLSDGFVGEPAAVQDYYDTVGKFGFVVGDASIKRPPVVFLSRKA